MSSRGSSESVCARDAIAIEASAPRLLANPLAQLAKLKPHHRPVVGFELGKLVRNEHRLSVSERLRQKHSKRVKVARKLTRV